MKYINYCPICNSKKLIAYSGITVPFIADRVWNTKPLETKFMRCKNCGFEFYDLRMEEEEIAALYKSWRGDKYLKQRQKYEPKYTREFNKQVGHHPMAIKNKKSNLSKIIKDHIPGVDSVKSILDFGGDKGQYIVDDFINAEKYVYDISGVELVEGVKRISDFNKKFDFIMCCHILEHISYPREILDQVKKFSHKNTIFYFEVPIDTPFKFPITSVRRIVKKILLSNPLFCNCFYKIFKFIPWMPFPLYMHEHVNYFSIRSLSYLIASSGLKIRYIGIKPIDFGFYIQDTIGCLASF